MSRDFLQSHVGPQSPMVLGYNPLENSPWLSRKWRVTINHMLDRRDLGPETAGTWGALSVYKLPKLAEKITKIQLVTVVSPLTRVAGTYARFEDFVGFDHIDRVELSYAGNMLQTLYSLQLYFWHRMHKRQDKQDAEAVITAGNLTVAERNALALGAQTWYLDLPFFFTYETHSSFPLMVLADELRLEVYFKNLQNIVQSDDAVGNITCTITNQYVKVTFVHNINLERNIVKQGAQEGNGLLFPILDVERQTQVPLLAGDTQYPVRLTNVKSPCTYYQFVLRKNSNINTNNGNTFNAFENLKNHDLYANSQPLVRTIEHDYNLFYLNPLYYEGPCRDSIYGNSFSLVPENKYDANGSNLFSNQNNPTINIQMPATLGENYYFDGLFYVENFIQLKGADVIKVFK